MIKGVMEAIIVAASITYLVTGASGALIAWEAVAVLYVVVGAIRTMSRPSVREDDDQSRFAEAIAWIFPLVASATGITSAITALAARGAASVHGPDLVLAVLASVGVLLSWLLFHIGFANIYQVTQRRDGRTPGIAFPKKMPPTVTDYLYFSFAIGTAFATSDADVLTSRMRWTVMTHSILSFFYNALVVAVAFQVLQQSVA
ncbi:DUF1345 domain-containing protein [Curtobacterium flaccumfaciens]|uniref:DUF1345 domain-containing protein n=2 Tax=Curtobacterium flaccumfaciens TaxID=2035 RepID=UPI00265A5D00|nr:DUF1345 domain-containing protein [Curtobacterium flaccumfaciens]MCS0476108.1 DUF1345 domain-containing protein [Curtobacterium flaccumfaciens pv. betae]MCS0479270.1 DUF1345 domain-containing protein [Curtobacterium flaccumfaciens pv. betae]